MKTNDRLFVEFHVLQSVSPSCINRDDTGSPKTAVYGGVTRARVSSQSWKHAVRKTFMESLSSEKLGKRTKKIVGMVSDEIRKLDGAVDAEAAAQEVLKAAGLNIKSPTRGRTRCSL
jgi:CRISPR system Cascade subunit CasC